LISAPPSRGGQWREGPYNSLTKEGIIPELYSEGSQKETGLLIGKRISTLAEKEDKHAGGWEKPQGLCKLNQWMIELFLNLRETSSRRHHFRRKSKKGRGRHLPYPLQKSQEEAGKCPLEKWVKRKKGNLLEFMISWLAQGEATQEKGGAAARTFRQKMMLNSGTDREEEKDRCALKMRLAALAVER